MFIFEVVRLEGDFEQQLKRVNKKKNTEVEKVLRTNQMNTELGKHGNNVTKYF